VRLNFDEYHRGWLIATVEKVLIDERNMLRFASDVHPRSAGPCIDNVDFAKRDRTQVEIVGAMGIEPWSSSSCC